jgi:putative heme iron utilization protein
MNGDHADANVLVVQALAGLGDATEASMVGIDRYGMTLRARTPAGPRLARVAFPEALCGADQARPAVIERLDAARRAAARMR